MNGPGHFAEAERLLALSCDFTADGGYMAGDRCTARAQVHATLALAAATAELDLFAGGVDGCGTGRSDVRAKAWAPVLAPTAVSS